MQRRRKVALLFDVGAPHLAQTAKGISDYAAEHDGWQFTFAPESGRMPVRSILGWPGDGVIGMVTDRGDIAAARQFGRPFVNIGSVLGDTQLPRVMVDHEAVGRMAAGHLIERGFRRLGHYGLRRVWFSQLRERGFAEAARRHGAQCAMFQTVSSLTRSFRWDLSVDSLRQWLASLEPPVGILAVNDQRAEMVVEATLDLGLNVPHDVAVLGVGNKQATCEACRVPISSVMRNGRQVGYEAAAMLDRFMSGRRVPRSQILVPPEGIACRRSTETIAIADPHVKAAVRFIDEHLGEPFGVEALEAVVPISRRALEQRFRRCLNRSPYEHICRMRLDRAKQMLVSPQEDELQAISGSCGFSDSRALRHAFQRIMGMSPAEYRRARTLGA